MVSASERGEATSGFLRLGLTAGKTQLRHAPYDGGSGSGSPKAGRESCAQPGVFPAVPKQRLRRSERLRSVFRTDAAAWPHRAGTLTWPRRGVRASPPPQRSWSVAALELAAAARSRKMGAAIPRGEFAPCDPPCIAPAMSVRSA
jgi:hypothetical protein